MNDKYRDMLFLPHPDSVSHPRMSLQDRAAQFSPFAALTGYDDAIKEKSRLTENFIELDEDRKQEIDRKLFYLQQHMQEKTDVNIIYFVPDSKKEGGKYQNLRGTVAKIDITRRILRIAESEISIDKIYDIDFL